MTLIVGGDGLPLRRSTILLNTVGLGYLCGVQLLRQTDGWYKGVKAVWVPKADGTLHDILWTSFDQDEPVPDWIRRVPCFTIATAVLTSASTSPWTVDPSWNSANNSVEMLGSGGNGAAGAQNSTTSAGGGGGGSGAYLQLTNGAVSGTVPFRIGTVSNSATNWEEAGTSGAGYYATNGGFASGATGGTAVGQAAGADGTPPNPFTVAISRLGVAGANSGSALGGGGGCGAPGPLGVGGIGWAPSSTAGGGGGGANHGSAGNATSQTGGQGSSGSGGGANTTGTGSSGGGGGNAAATGSSTGGAGGAGVGDFADLLTGCGGGGGGGGRITNTGSGQTSTGANGGLYGGAGGGGGGLRGTGTSNAGVGANGVIVITWPPSCPHTLASMGVGCSIGWRAALLNHVLQRASAAVERNDVIPRRRLLTLPPR